MKLEEEITEIKKFLSEIQEQLASNKAYLKALLDERDEQLGRKLLSKNHLLKEEK